MIKIENTQVFGWDAAFRGMRNPKNSWDKADSYWGFLEDPSPINPDDVMAFIIGPNDMKLAKTLSKAGNDHGKFLRMIHVQCDITAPLYWWKEVDTYKVGTVANSCSTMHKIHSKKFERDDFSHEHLATNGMGLLDATITFLNQWRDYFNSDEIKREDSVYKKDCWWQMIQSLPSSYNQRRTYDTNYAVLKNMYFARRDHKLDEWHEFCAWCESLPYFKEIVIQEDDA